ncbi:hypothetical protein E2C01_070734 [Portunus trituberculatus]|uniref:Uncharacterized protein n=1 Tax=Portunus trituberculatus TaxID=210409 RepID=A0A5B7I684_PORTR|nr:hypothetical protein [Portunus trituberculatus]
MSRLVMWVERTMPSLPVAPAWAASPRHCARSSCLSGWSSGGHPRREGERWGRRAPPAEECGALQGLFECSSRVWAEAAGTRAEDSRAAASGQYRFLLCQECAPRKNQSGHLPAPRPSLARLEALAAPARRHGGSVVAMSSKTTLMQRRH